MKKGERRKGFRLVSDYVSKLPAIYISLLLLFIIVIIFVLINRSFLSIYNLKTIGNLTAILQVVSIFLLEGLFLSYLWCIC
ncbi:MAG: hypothetical protein AMS17_17975 [Spirochaetes bacterium DG_61]|nr:MAG: hypothetical protein AMS17_17975 [Spirochaetes bacterium DG_61]